MQFIYEMSQVRQEAQHVDLLNRGLKIVYNKEFELAGCIVLKPDN